MYKRKLKPVYVSWYDALTDEEMERMEEIEGEVDFDLLLLFRSVAIEELRIEMQKNEELIQITKQQQASEVNLSESYPFSFVSEFS